jgi:hypothetical protein
MAGAWYADIFLHSLAMNDPLSAKIVLPEKTNLCRSISVSYQCNRGVGPDRITGLGRHHCFRKS